MYYSSHLMTDEEEEGEKQGERFGIKHIKRNFIEDIRWENIIKY